MRNAQRNLWTVALWACLLSAPLPAQELRRVESPVAQLNVATTRIDWLPLVDYESLVLTIAGPKDLYLRKEFGAGQSPYLNLFDSGGSPLPDGMYTYELRVLPREKAEDSGRSLRHSGYLAVKGGSFVTQSQLRRITAEETIPENLAVQGGVCIGFECEEEDADNGGILTLKSQDTLGIFFDDFFGISAVHDWFLQANDLFAGAGEFFSIVDGETNFKLFTVEGDAPDASLYVRSNGNVGLGTSTPAVRLDVRANVTGQAAARLQNSSASGYSGTEYLDNTGNVDLFFGVDNAASTTRLNSINNNPIVILTNSTERMRVTSGGNVGIGTTGPSNPLHVRRSDGTAKVFIEEASGSAASRELLELKNLGGAAFILDDTNDPSRWTMTAFGSSYLINNQNNPGVEVTVSATGNMTIAGTLTEGSDRAMKTAIVPVQPEEVLAKLVSLPISTWSRKAGDPQVRHLGPMAQDFSAIFGLGDDNRHIAPLDMAGVSMASIQALHGKMTREMAEKDAEIETLRQRLAALEELVSKLAAPQ